MSCPYFFLDISMGLAVSILLMAIELAGRLFMSTMGKLRNSSIQIISILWIIHTPEKERKVKYDISPGRKRYVRSQLLWSAQILAQAALLQ